MILSRVGRVFFHYLINICIDFFLIGLIILCVLIIGCYGVLVT